MTMEMLILFVTLVLTVEFPSVVTSSGEDDQVLTVLMPNAVSDRPDALICTSVKLDPEETYITKFIPHASKVTSHHMMVYGCHTTANKNLSWLCHEDEGRQPSEYAVCGSNDRQIIFAWAVDAPEKSLPEGVGLRVSGDTGINYLVVQLHYAKAFPPGVTDNSGMTFFLTRTRPPQQVGYLVLGNWGTIPPKQTAYHMDSICENKRNYTIYPIGYRTHSHNLGVVTSGYRIRDGQWMEIGRMSPQLPQWFYQVSHPGMDIRHGDVLAARCTMNSMEREDITKLGPSNHDEMCNFYILYSTYEQQNLKTDLCFGDSSSNSWTDTFGEEVIPSNSMSLDGISGADEVREKFKWS